jgi:hypothetical protein
MWSSWVKRKGTTQVMYIAKLRMVQKELRKLSQRFWRGFLKWYDEGGENHIKRFLKLKCFSPLRILTSSLFFETLGAFFSFFFLFLFSHFFNTFSLFFSMLRLLRNWGF